eukprot:g3225.t1
MIVIFVLCGLFAWLCIVKTCCSVWNKRSGGADAYGNHMPGKRLSARDANDLWDEIQRTPPVDDKRERLLDNPHLLEAGSMGNGGDARGASRSRSRRSLTRSDSELLPARVPSNALRQATPAAASAGAGHRPRFNSEEAPAASAQRSRGGSGDGKRWTRRGSLSRAIPRRSKSKGVSFHHHRRVIDEVGSSYQEPMSVSGSVDVEMSNSVSSSEIACSASPASIPSPQRKSVLAGVGADVVDSDDPFSRGAVAVGVGGGGSKPDDRNAEMTLTQLPTPHREL